MGSYEVQYTSTSPLSWDTNTTVFSQSWTPENTGSPETRIITGLNINTSYYIAIRTSDKVPLTSGDSDIVTGLAVGVVPSAITDKSIPL